MWDLYRSVKKVSLSSSNVQSGLAHQNNITRIKSPDNARIKTHSNTKPKDS
jgi:hypothetical protein